MVDTSGLIDGHLLAPCKLANATLLTKDKRLISLYPKEKPRIKQVLMDKLGLYRQ